MNIRLGPICALLMAVTSLSVWAGATSSNDIKATCLCDSQDAGSAEQKTMAQDGGDMEESRPSGMTRYTFMSLLASLHLEDTPIEYNPPVGPRMKFTLTYNHREAKQPPVFNFFNVGQKWTFNWLSFIEDDPATPSANVLRYLAGGGSRQHLHNSGGVFRPEQSDGALLVRVSSNPITYELRLPDGSKSVFGHSNGATTNPRRVLLTQVIDPQGNSVTLDYDSQHRLTGINDAIGQTTTLQYGNASNPLLVTGITDPFERSAQFAYDSNGRLESITDALGVVSSFTYEAAPGTFITSLTTPFGTTTFAKTEGVGSASQASIQATDPDGETERTEYLHAAPGIAFSEPVDQVPAGMTTRNEYLNYRNSFYWDKEAFKSACTISNGVTTCDYTKARLKHFLHLTTPLASRVLESIKNPGESRTWYFYPGSTNAAYIGTLDRPSHVGRVLSGGTTQLTKYLYNTQGNRTSEIDPAGRETLYEYAANGVDVLRKKRKTPSGYQVIGEWTYNSQHRPLTHTDAASQTTTYTYNARGQVTSITNPLNEVTTYGYNGSGYLVSIDEPGRHTDYTYDSGGNRNSATVTDTATGESRITAWTYNTLGQLLTVDGPRTDVSDITTYAYDAQGNIASVTNALDQVTEITDYDEDGRPLQTVDPNGVVTALTYDAAERLKTRAVDGATTTFSYDSAGKVTKVTQPDGSFLAYAYDNAHRLVDMTDNSGNRIHYTLDVIGNRTKEEIFDAGNVLRRAQSRVFDTLGRLDQIKNAASQIVTQYGYDGRDFRTTQTDAGTYTTQFAPDALNRTQTVTDAANGTTQYGYNALGQVTSITDPNGLTTTYSLNAFAERTRQESPDSGITTYTYDKAGNRKTQTDARSVAVAYNYDALNRLTFIDYPGIAEDVTYSYDSAAQPYGRGRLTGVVDESGATTLIYDQRGNVTEEQRFIGSMSYVTKYSYDAADRVSDMTYPSGRKVIYTRNALGQISKVESIHDGVTTTVAQDIAYMAFGGVKSYRLGNDVTVTRDFDGDYRLAEIRDQGIATAQNLKFHYDLRGNLSQIEDLRDATHTQDFGFDALSRLTSADGAYGLKGFTYDAIGNRLTQTVTPPGGTPTTDTYTYPSTSHRLSARTSGATYDYDAAGNVSNTGTLALSYNNAGRVTSAGNITAVYSASGQRVKKTANGVTTIFHYDRAGQLIAEQTDSGLWLGREYVWLEGIPLVVASERKIPDYYVDNGGLGFSTSGAWATASTADQYGSSYAKRGPAMEVPGESVVDDRDSGASYTGLWLDSTVCSGSTCLPVLNGVLSNEAPHEEHFYRSVPNGTPVFSWQTTLPGAGRYRVYVRWVPINGSGPANYTVSHSGGSSQYAVDQSLSSGGWYALGVHEFGTTASVQLAPNDGFVAVADAIKIVPIEYSDNDYARWAARGEDGTYDVYGRWPTVSGASTAAPFSIVDEAGSLGFTVDQTTNTGQWISLGTNLTFSDMATHGVRLGAVWDQTVLADAIRFVPVDEYARRETLAYFHVDQLNTPQKLTDANQVVVWEASYEPFGDATVTTQPFLENPLRFPGQYFDAETGLHQNWHRDYDPSIGRYLQPDPTGLDDGPNVYAYAGSNPVNYFDFEGEARRKCSGRVYLILRGAVLATCKVPTRCESDDSCNMLRLKIATKQLCIAAQEALSRACFPSDQTHKQRVEDEKKGIKRCEDFKKTACPECEEQK
jgi:RHS repeat-associated protein